MFNRRTVVVMTCGLALTTPALAQKQQEQAAAFQYSPVARVMHGGQFQAEIWRRDVRTDESDLAWSNQERYATAAKATAEACASLQKNFDASFSCPRAAKQASAGDRAAAAPGITIASFCLVMHHF